MRSQKLGTEGESLCAMQLYLSRPWQMAGYLPCGILYFHDIGQFRSAGENPHGENHVSPPETGMRGAKKKLSSLRSSSTSSSCALAPSGVSVSRCSLPLWP